MEIHGYPMNVPWKTWRSHYIGTDLKTHVQIESICIKWFQNENVFWRISSATSNIVGNKHGDRAEPFLKESLVNAHDFKKAKNS